MKIKKDFIIQFIKFGLVGCINTVLSYGITNIGYYILKFNEQISNLIAFIITVGISYVLNNKYVFNEKNEKVNVCKSIIKVYASYSITGLFLTSILLYIEEQLLGIPHYIATLLNLFATVPINFLLNKFWVYKKNNKTAN